MLWWWLRYSMGSQIEIKEWMASRGRQLCWFTRRSKESRGKMRFRYPDTGDHISIGTRRYSPWKCSKMENYQITWKQSKHKTRTSWLRAHSFDRNSKMDTSHPRYHIDKQVTENLGLPSKSPCFFCHPTHESVELKELLNMLLRVYNLNHTAFVYDSGFTGDSIRKESMLAWWKCVGSIYQRLRNYENVQRNPGIPHYISVEKQQWLTLYFASALDCDFPIIEALATYWPALRITKRDIHDHLCYHKVYTISPIPHIHGGGMARNITPWAACVEILF